VDYNVIGETLIYGNPSKAPARYGADVKARPEF